MAAWWMGMIAVVAGCYSPPTPACGFACGIGGTCQDGYSCNSNDRRCHLEGTTEDCDPASNPGDVEPPPPPPMPVWFDPPRGSTGVKTTDVVTAYFDVQVQDVSESTFQLRVDNVPIGGSVVYDPSMAKATFIPTHLPSNSIVVASLDPTIATVGKDSTSIGIQLWSFATEVDTTPPAVLGSFPQSGDFGTSVCSQIGLVFDEDVAQPWDLVVSTGGVRIPGSVQYQNQEQVYEAWFTLTDREFPPSSMIEVTTSAITDYAGNHVEPFALQFTTGPDACGPQVVSTSPLPNAHDVPTTSPIVFTFDEPVIFSGLAIYALMEGITGTVTANPDGRSLTYTPDTPFPSGTEITLLVTVNVTDLAGNPANYFFSFMTK